MMANDNGKSAWKNRIVGYGEENPSQLLANPLNFRIHPKDQQAATEGSLDTLGWIDDVIINKTTGHVVDGHLRVTLALRNNAATVPVKYVELTEEEEAQALISLDPIAAMAATDKQKLDTLIHSVQSDDKRVMEYIAELAEREGIQYGAPPPDDPGAQIDKAEELREKWGVESGQMWKLGEHRLICGDCTDRATVDSVMGGEKAQALITDPPYGINIVGKNGTAGNFPGTNAPRLKSAPIVGDDKPFDPAHLLDVAEIVVLWGGNNFSDKLCASSKWLVWDKKDGAFEESDLGDCELAWTNQKGAPRLIHHTWQGMYRKGEGEREARFHPTQKPVALIEWCIEKMNIPDGAIVCDFYLGSGTTLIACERLNRKCRAVEISPAYCAVAIQRWVDLTQGIPELLE